MDKIFLIIEGAYTKKTWIKVTKVMPYIPIFYNIFERLWLIT